MSNNAIFILHTKAINGLNEYRVSILPEDFSEREDNPKSTKTRTDAYKICQAFGGADRFLKMSDAITRASAIAAGRQIKTIEIPISYDTFLNQYCESYWKNHRLIICGEKAPVQMKDSEVLETYINLKRIRRQQIEEQTKKTEKKR